MGDAQDSRGHTGHTEHRHQLESSCSSNLRAGFLAGVQLTLHTAVSLWEPASLHASVLTSPVSELQRLIGIRGKHPHMLHVRESPAFSYSYPNESPNLLNYISCIQPETVGPKSAATPHSSESKLVSRGTHACWTAGSTGV